jgi:mRNA-degrading endonuclease YafQ of YafQ-DinJ toxin-antitoxin module
MRRLVWESSFRKAFKRATRRAPDLSDKVFILLVDIGTHDEVY